MAQTLCLLVSQVVPVFGGHGSPFNNSTATPRTSHSLRKGDTAPDDDCGDDSNGEYGSDGGSVDEAGGGGGAAGDGGADDDDTCPVCLDEPPNLQLLQCHHRLCLGCARDLTQRHALTPVLCPYCRTVIAGFQLAAVCRK